MKNRYIELNRQRARHYHSTQAGSHYYQGIYVPYDYSDVDPNGLSWWDDAAFIQGRMRIYLAWQHPRHAYGEKIRDAAYQAAENSEHGATDSLLKKLDEQQKQLNQQADYVIHPSVYTRLTPWGKSVRLVAPFEIRTAAEMRKAVEQVRRLLRHEITLQDMFPNYQYTQKDWLAEQADMLDPN